MHRGHATVALDRPKCVANLGGALRAAQVYGAALVVVANMRMGRFATDTMKAWRHIPVQETDDVFAHIPYASVPVAVEIHPRASSLITFAHPERAFYIFGPEDGSVKKDTLERCRHIVAVPSNGCMNLAATVNVVLYDRLAKQHRARLP